VPLQIGRRRAALEQARAEAEQASLERQGAADEIRAEVESAAARLRESHHLLAITRDRAIPAARDGLAAARAGYETGVRALRRRDRSRARAAPRGVGSNAPSARKSPRGGAARCARHCAGRAARNTPESAAQTPAGGSHD
jgi:hypothetical protein